MNSTNYNQEIEAIVASMKLPKEAQALMLDSIYENIKINVGLRLAQELSDEAITQIQPMLDSADNDKIFNEITKIEPTFKQILEEEIARVQQALAADY